MKTSQSLGKTNAQATSYSASAQSQIGINLELDSNTTIIHFSDLQFEETAHFSNLRISLDSNQRDALLALLQESA